MTCYPLFDMDGQRHLNGFGLVPDDMLDDLLDARNSLIVAHMGNSINSVVLLYDTGAIAFKFDRATVQTMTRSVDYGRSFVFNHLMTLSYNVKVQHDPDGQLTLRLKTFVDDPNLL